MLKIRDFRNDVFLKLFKLKQPRCKNNKLRICILFDVLLNVIALFSFSYIYWSLCPMYNAI